MKKFVILTFVALAAGFSPAFAEYQPTRKAVPAGAWNSIGTGTWGEGLFPSYFEDIPAGLTWDVPMEESAEKAGFYRLKPYAVTDNPVYEVIELYDYNYVYVDASNPDKVNIYTVESDENSGGDLVLFDALNFSLVNTDNDWPEGNDRYGRLENGVITFPIFSFVLFNGAEWVHISGSPTIGLPGAYVEDFTFSAQAPMSADGNEIEVTFTAGRDIASVKYLLVKGYGVYDETNTANAAKQGTEVNPSAGVFTVTPDERGLYTLVVVALDANGIRKDSKNLIVFGVDDEENLWSDYGYADIRDGFLNTALGLSSRTINVKAEKHNEIEGYYRLVNPYESLGIAGTSSTGHADHNHYIYIDATNPDKVLIEASPLGVSLDGYGEAGIWSTYFTAKAMFEGIFGKEDDDDSFYASYYGKMKDNKITMPDGALVLMSTSGGKTLLEETGKGFSVTLGVEAGIEDVAAESCDAPRYFNLQGIEVSAPEPGNLYIMKRDGSACKILFR